MDCGGGGVEIGRVGEDGGDLVGELLVAEFMALGAEGDADGEVLLVEEVAGVEPEAVGLRWAAGDFACDVELGTLARNADQEFARAIVTCVDQGAQPGLVIPSFRETGTETLAFGVWTGRSVSMRVWIEKGSDIPRMLGSSLVLHRMN